MKSLYEKFNGFAPGQVSLAESFNGFANLNESKGNPIYLRGRKGLEPYNTPEMYKSALKVAVKKFEQWLKKVTADKKKFQKEFKKTSDNINKLSAIIEKMHIIDGVCGITEPTELINPDSSIGIGLDCGLYEMGYSRYDDCILGPELYVDDLLPDGILSDIEDDVKDMGYSVIHEYFEDMVMELGNKTKDLVLSIRNTPPNGDSILIKFEKAILTEEYENIMSKSISFDLSHLSQNIENAIERSNMLYFVTDYDDVLHIPLFNFFFEKNVKHFKRIFGVNIPKIQTNLYLDL